MVELNQTAEDYHLDVLAEIDLKKTRFSPSVFPIVLLCGGRVADSQLAISFRHALTIHTPQPRYEFFRPEEITDWKDDGVFYDLLDFEKELGAICNLIVVILESEGAFAELGAFSQMPDLKGKVCAINSEAFSSLDSFINLGVLRHIEQSSGIKARVYPWDSNQPEKIEASTVQDAIDDINEQLTRTRSQHVFNVNNDSHIITLIVELIKFFVALKESDILSYLDALGIKMKRDLLRRKLFLLERFRIIINKRYSDSSFYLRASHQFSRIRFGADDNFHFDDLRISMRCKELYIKEKKHRHRDRVIKSWESNNG
ncbi:retron St85 family effector protein [Halomonas sp. AOP25-F1-15]|uniref:retron St85 family effector protein n=1 Tax=Halomonas sp. AOP25-F1-15 TaxID=3457709 RepID=UPI0040339E03